MKKILLFFLVMSAVPFFFSQNHSTANGYKLKDTITFVYVYRDLDNKPDFSVRNRWDHRYWFVVDPTIKYKDPKTEETYIRITIPANKRYDDELKKWVTNNAYRKQVKWEDEQYIDGSDFNSWLWIKETEFIKLKEEYHKREYNFVLSGLTVPFKFRPKTAAQSSSVITGDLNLGTFIGVRTNWPAFGVSVGGHFGISSMSQNASSNTALSGSQTETVQGFVYGYGVIVDIKNKFQIGLVGGFDYSFGDLAKTYVYQNRPWFAFSLNYKFLDFGKKEEDNSNKGKAPN